MEDSGRGYDQYLLHKYVKFPEGKIFYLFN